MPRVLWIIVAVSLLSPPVWAGSVRIGSIAADPAREIKKFLPLAAYLAKELGSEGGGQGSVVVARDIPQMAKLMREGKVDLYIDSPFPSLAVSRLAGSRLLLRRWKKGVAQYHAVIFARQDGGIRRLEDLRGKVIVFEDPFSSTGFFFPKLALRQAGLRPVALRQITDPVGRDAVGYVFSGDDENVLVWVGRGKVAAGATDNHTYLEEARSYLDVLTIIHRTDSMPRQIVSVRADLPASLVTRIQEILGSMARSEGGRRALEAFEGTAKFDAIPESALRFLRQAAPFVDEEIGRR